MSAGFQQRIDPAEGFALLIHHRQTDQVSPVVLVPLRAWQGFARRPDKLAIQAFGTAAVIDTVQLGNPAVAMQPNRLQLDGLPVLASASASGDSHHRGISPQAPGSSPNGRILTQPRTP